MSKKIILYKDGKEILGSNGVFRIDGRCGYETAKAAVIENNRRMMLSFPEKVADAFSVWRIGATVPTIPYTEI